MEYGELTEKVIGCAYSVYNKIGFELIDQHDKKNYHVHPVNPVKNS
jgi:hypothetical protein